MVLLCDVLLLFLQRFFIGYWILKTGLDFYPGPIFFITRRSFSEGGLPPSPPPGPLKGEKQSTVFSLAVISRQSSVSSHQSSVGSYQSTVSSHQSTVNSRQSTVRMPEPIA